MHLRNLELSNFRNYKSLKLELKPGLNIFIEKNAQGKTNLLESIYRLSSGSSYRTIEKKEAISWGDEMAIVRGRVKKNNKESFIEIFFPRKGNKRARVNGSYLKRISDLWGNLIVVMFSLQDLDMVRSSPVYRGQFLDRILNQINPEYRHHFERYQRIFNQRNSLLKLFHLASNRKKIINTIDLWNRLFVTSGSFIIMERIKLLEILNNLAKGVIDKIPINGKLEICYSTSMSVEKKDKIKEIEDEMLRKLKERQKRDISIGVTTIGPHRDDIKITIWGRDARNYGSGGQQRMIALSLKFAELNFYNEKLGKKPILLLDEVLSELDENKRRALLTISQDVKQTIITSTHYPQLLKTKKSKISTYLVENGKIKVWQ